jgi:hypothetical protein
MTMDAQQDQRLDKALDGISVTPPEPAEAPPSVTPDHPTTDVRDAHDAEHHEELANDPSHEDSKLDVGLDESFPTSDPASATQPGHADPAPSSGYDEEAEKALEREKAENR